MLKTLLTSPDGTVKFLFKLEDGKSVEAVLVPFPTRDSVCLSSQVGCAMGCRFCHTGLQGLDRHLAHSEILAQYQAVWDWLRENRPLRPRPNVVFMGQGEPLHNFDELKKAIEGMQDPRGLGIGARNITVSTSGYLPGIQRFHELGGVNFALSLHSPFDHERSELIPLNQRWPLETLFAAIDLIPLRRRQFINCEYLVIQGLNHSQRHADALAQWLGPREAIVNLIPFNAFPGAAYARPSGAEIDSFKTMLVQHRLRVFTRTTKGSDILAACGQLNTMEKAEASS